MTRHASLIDRSVRPALRKVAKSSSYFFKDAVVREVLARHGIADAIIDMRRSYRGLGLDEAVISYVETRVSTALRERDEHGVRIYESYSAGPGQHRWMRFRSMTATDLRRVVEEYRSLRSSIDDKIVVYELALEEMERRGSSATISAVYDYVVTTLQLGPERSIRAAS